MKIRYYKKGSNVRRTTNEFDPNGTPTGAKRLAVLRDGKYLTSTALFAAMEGFYFPLVELPRYHWDVVQNVPITQPDGTIILMNVYTKIEDVTQAQYEGNVALFEQALRDNFVFVEEVAMPSIPDVGYIWEVVDLTKPYQFRYTPFTGDRSLFKGNFYRLAAVDMYAYFTDRAALSTNPIYTLSRIIKY
jgi:hypothetical protein